MDSGVDFRQALLLFRWQHFQDWLGRSLGIALADEAVEETAHLIVFALRHRVELVIMTLRTLHGEAEECGRGRVDAINEILDTVVFINNSAFVGGRIVAQEAGGDLLFLARIWQEVTRELPGDEVAVG